MFAEQSPEEIVLKIFLPDRTVLETRHVSTTAATDLRLLLNAFIAMTGPPLLSVRSCGKASL